MAGPPSPVREKDQYVTAREACHDLNMLDTQLVEQKCVDYVVGDNLNKGRVRESRVKAR